MKKSLQQWRDFYDKKLAASTQSSDAKKHQSATMSLLISYSNVDTTGFFGRKMEMTSRLFSGKWNTHHAVKVADALRSSFGMGVPEDLQNPSPQECINMVGNAIGDLSTLSDKGDLFKVLSVICEKNNLTLAGVTDRAANANRSVASPAM